MNILLNLVCLNSKNPSFSKILEIKPICLYAHFDKI